MKQIHAPFISRRSFLQRIGPAVFGTSALACTLRDLRLMNSAMAQAGGISDYKALICIFLNGGNDANNLIIPTIPSEYNNYANVRTPAIALPNMDGSAATALQLKNAAGTGSYQDAAGHNYGLHPAMPELQTLFNSGKCAVLLNVGTLSYPLTKAQYTAKSVPFPPQLFSHSDQQTQWQTSIPDAPPTSGWFGRMDDLFTQPVDVNTGGQISMAVTVAGSNVLEVGNVNAAPQYAITTGGAVTISNVSGGRLTTLQSILNTDKLSSDLQTSAYAKVLDHAISEASLLSSALTTQNTSNGGNPPAWFSRFNPVVVTPNGGTTNNNSSLMAQMKMVARLIDLGSTVLNMKRQVFFIQVGGYDTHTGQTNNAGQTTTNNASVVIGAQANLFAELSQTINALMLALGDIGTLRSDPTFVNKVTAFTVSDFARTFPSNGSGSDHGWGGHHVIVGGAVNGGATYGKFPTLAVNGPDDTGIGRWIPTTSVDQYAATLASWFGVQSSNIPILFPNIGRFASSNLGFI
jgi:uncharacterized protein (DUF1501 family)